MRQTRDRYKFCVDSLFLSKSIPQLRSDSSMWMYYTGKFTYTIIKHRLFHVCVGVEAIFGDIHVLF